MIAQNVLGLGTNINNKRVYLNIYNIELKMSVHDILPLKKVASFRDIC